MTLEDKILEILKDIIDLDSIIVDDDFILKNFSDYIQKTNINQIKEKFKEMMSEEKLSRKIDENLLKATKKISKKIC